MKKGIKRRDFLNGAALGLVGISALTPKKLLADAITATQSYSDAEYYPPILTGIRGSHKGSFENAHNLAWRGIKPKQYADVNEEYDLVVVGGGISGLAAAYSYQKEAGLDKRILILDNHDDFGGHAKRNEFHTQDKMLLGFGGSQNLEASDDYSALTKSFLKDLGIDLDKLHKATEEDYPLSSLKDAYGMYLGQEHNNQIVKGNWTSAFHGLGEYRPLIDQLPVAADEKTKLINFIKGDRDYLDDLSITEKYDYIRSTSYHQFMMERVDISPSTLPILDTMARFAVGFGGDSLSVLEAIVIGAPGFKSLGWLGKLADKLMYDADQPYKATFFPDGNASIARLLVRKMIPEVAAGHTMEDVVTAKFDYSKLDSSLSATRIRLNSTVVNVEHQDDDSVSIGYITQGNAYRVRAKHTILACYNGIIPHLCPELPEAQKEGLKYGVKTPIVYTNVLLRTGSPFYNAGSKLYTCPNSYFNVVTGAPPTHLGEFKPPANPEDPLVLFMGHMPTPSNNGNQSVRELFRLGRHQLYMTSFDTYEQEIRQQLTAMFGAYGFDAERDIEAITVNRWSHGYAYHYFMLHDPQWPEGKKPHEIGRQRYGRISIANSDSEASPYIWAAIESGIRAVDEQLKYNS